MSKTITDGSLPTATATSSYPTGGSERDDWILARRAARNAVEPLRPYDFLVEEEVAETGELLFVATIFLANRECPWRCLMCDLWKNTLTETVPPGAIPAQIDYALKKIGTREDGRPPSQLKLYNSGSFFDSRAIPVEDYSAIAQRVRTFERVIVECHPVLVGDSCARFRDLLKIRDHRPIAETRLEVAMGLETAHPQVLEKLNKRMTIEQFSRAAEWLRRNEIALRVFVLVKPPFLDEPEALHWARRSIDLAFDCGATVVSLIPTRLGNGALETLAERGEFSPPKLATLEAALRYGIGLKRGRVFADLWDLQKFSDCPACFTSRAARLREINRHQTWPQEIDCPQCGGVR
ncbi:MAG: radical SAM protein [Verrucomicrobiota bacterium]